MKKVVVLKTSLRQNGNSDLLANEFEKGAKDKGHEVNSMTLINKTIGFCRGCLSCQKTGQCIILDDVAKIVEEVRGADVVVFATPIYYYEMAGQMKTLIDRLNPIYALGHHFSEVYLLASAADQENSALDGAIKGTQGFVDCFSNVRLGGVVYGTGATNIGDIVQNTEAMELSYKMGYEL